MQVTVADQLEQLIDREFAVKGMPSRETVCALEIERRDDLLRDDQLLESWRVGGDGVCRDLAEPLALALPGRAPERERRPTRAGRKPVGSGAAATLISGGP